MSAIETATGNETSVGKLGASGSARSSRLPGAVLFLLSVATAAVVFLWAWSLGGSRTPVRAAPLPVVRAVPEFSLTERSDRSVSRADLLGHVWIADFIFTDCPGPCPKLSARMLAIQRALKNRDLPAKLVSFSLDPLRDRPSVLRQYAKRFKADTDTWWFLTSDDEDGMLRLVVDGFLQAVVPASGGDPLQHSTYFVIVDSQGKIRSFHDGLDPTISSRELVNRVVADVQSLLDEPAR